MPSTADGALLGLLLLQLLEGRVDLGPRDELVDPALALFLHVSLPDDDDALLDVLRTLAVVQQEFLQHNGARVGLACAISLYDQVLCQDSKIWIFYFMSIDAAMSHDVLCHFYHSSNN